jgi:hypothetical protein
MIEWPMPPEPARSIICFGDAHFYPSVPAGSQPNIPERPEKVLQAVKHAGSKLPQFAGALQIGDLTEDGEATQIANAQAWRAAMAAELGVPLDLIIGNHDRHQQPTGAQWAATYGYLGTEWVRDLGFALLIGIDYLVTTTVANWLDAQLAAATKPCIVAVHFPPGGSIDAGVGRHSGLDASGVYQMAAADWTRLKAVLNARAIAKVLVTGHVHAWYDAGGFTQALDLGSRKIAFTNTSALTYVGASVGGGTGFDLFSDPLIGYVVSLPSADPDKVEVRLFDFGNELWRPRQKREVSLL